MFSCRGPSKATAYIGVPADPAQVFATPEQLRSFLGFASDDTTSLSDSEADDLMLRAQKVVERYTKLTLYDTTFTNLRDVFEHKIELRKAPSQSVTSVERQVNNIFELVDVSIFKLIRANQLFYSALVLKDSQFWPIDQDREEESIKIIFIAGFGPDKTTLPADLIAGLFRVSSDLFSNRGDCECDGGEGADQISAQSRAILNRFKIMEI